MMMIARVSKIVLVFAAAVYMALVAFNNLTDYGTNYAFVQHVLSMDAVAVNSTCLWRALREPVLYHACYWLIIAAEILTALLCGAGAVRLWQARRDPARFDKQKGIAVAGLTLGILLFFTGFTTVGGEWFQMWRSGAWNGQEPAFRLTATYGVFLIYLFLPDS